MDDTIQIIEKSPFVKFPDAEDGFCWSIEVKDPATNRMVETFISPYALLNSLEFRRIGNCLFAVL